MTYSQLMRFGTGLSIIKLTEFIQNNLTNITFPFVVFHDPNDEVCKFTGTQDLISLSTTTTKLKKLIEIPNGLHALIPNKSGFVIVETILWLKENIII